jgi:hypothetical protein
MNTERRKSIKGRWCRPGIDGMHAGTQALARS